MNRARSLGSNERMAASMPGLLFARVMTHVSPSRASILLHAQPAPGSDPLPGSHA